MKIAVLATVSGLFLAASTLALPATNSALPATSSTQDWQGVFMLIWHCHCRHQGGQDYKKHVKKDMQCMMDNTAISVGNSETGEKDSLVEMDKEIEKCKAAAWRTALHSECEPNQYDETGCYFRIWMEYSKCVGNRPSTSELVSDCPKDHDGKPEEAKSQGANSEKADECPEDPSSKPEEAKPQGAKTQGAKTQGAKTQGAKTQGAKTQGAKPEEVEPEKAAKTQEAKQA
ncbi:hypothetical protein E5D57_003531 [Metarhizium anisopliae]|nr:hypothetical protein E5D57_003531 [Metarhizium anisopliae]